MVSASTLSLQEISSLAAGHDIITLGMLADEARRRVHGLRTTFVRVATISMDDPPGSWGSPAGEIRIAGNPPSCRVAVDRVKAVVSAADGVPVSAFSLADLERAAAAESVTLRALLEDLHAAGLELIAEAAVDSLRDPRRSIEEVNIAGLALGRLTVQQLPSADVVAFFRRIADLQRQVAVIRSFAPLPRAVNAAVPTTGYDDVKRVALARLLVDNVPSIQVDWSLYGAKLSQVALTMGADDVDGIVPGDELGDGRRRSTLEEIRRHIRAAGQVPVERNARFDVLDDSSGPGSTPR